MKTVVPRLRAIASLGLTLYIFSVGLDFDVRCLAPVKGQVALLALLSTALPAGMAVPVRLCLEALPGGNTSFVAASAAPLPFNLALSSAFACRSCVCKLTASTCTGPSHESPSCRCRIER